MSHNANRFQAAIDSPMPSLPVCFVFGANAAEDKHGTLFAYVNGRWLLTELNQLQRRFHNLTTKLTGRLAVVTLEGDPKLRLAAIGYACDDRSGEWVVEACELSWLRDKYGETLTVVWEQPDETA